MNHTNQTLTELSSTINSPNQIEPKEVRIKSTIKEHHSSISDKNSKTAIEYKTAIK